MSDAIEVLARTIYEASDSYDDDGVKWDHQYGRAKREARAQAEAVLATRVTRPEAEVKAEALQAEAAFFETEMAETWGGPASWLTTGNRVGKLVADILRERATELLNEVPS